MEKKHTHTHRKKSARWLRVVSFPTKISSRLFIEFWFPNSSRQTHVEKDQSSRTVSFLTAHSHGSSVWIMHAGVMQPQSSGTVLSQGTELRPQEPSLCTRLSLTAQLGPGGISHSHSNTSQFWPHSMLQERLWQRSTGSILSQSKIRKNFAKHPNSMQTGMEFFCCLRTKKHNALPCWSVIGEESNVSQGKVKEYGAQIKVSPEVEWCQQSGWATNSMGLLLLCPSDALRAPHSPPGAQQPLMWGCLQIWAQKMVSSLKKPFLPFQRPPLPARSSRSSGKPHPCCSLWCPRAALPHGTVGSRPHRTHRYLLTVPQLQDGFRVSNQQNAEVEHSPAHIGANGSICGSAGAHRWSRGAILAPSTHQVHTLKPAATTTGSRWPQAEGCASPHCPELLYTAVSMSPLHSTHGAITAGDSSCCLPPQWE